MLGVLVRLLGRLGRVAFDRPGTESLELEPRRATDRYRLQDKRERVFTLVIDQEDPLGSRWWVLPDEGAHRGKQAALPAGYIEALRMPDDPSDTLTLADIRIKDVRDRHSGLGTAMLLTVFEVARREGIRYIHGFVTAEDQRNTPGLLDWYRREGFRVEQGCSTIIMVDLSAIPSSKD